MIEGMLDRTKFFSKALPQCPLISSVAPIVSLVLLSTSTSGAL